MASMELLLVKVPKATIPCSSRNKGEIFPLYVTVISSEQSVIMKESVFAFFLFMLPGFTKPPIFTESFGIEDNRAISVGV